MRKTDDLAIQRRIALLALTSDPSTRTVADLVIALGVARSTIYGWQADAK